MFLGLADLFLNALQQTGLSKTKIANIKTSVSPFRTTMSERRVPAAWGSFYFHLSLTTELASPGNSFFSEPLSPITV